jgi:hypothetical protein
VCAFLGYRYHAYIVLRYCFQENTFQTKQKTNKNNKTDKKKQQRKTAKKTTDKKKTTTTKTVNQNQSVFHFSIFGRYISSFPVKSFAEGVDSRPVQSVDKKYLWGESLSLLLKIHFFKYIFIK